MTLEFVIRVWDIPKEQLLFEGASSNIDPHQVIDILGLPNDDPEIWGAEYNATQQQGQKLLQLMGLRYSGPGSFRISRERS